MAGHPWHIGSILLLTALLVGAELAGRPDAVVASAGPGSPSTTVDTATAKWAWVVSRKAQGSWTPARKDRGNSSGDANVVTYQGAAGWYIVKFPGVAPDTGETGSVLVSTLGTQPRICASDDWYVVGDQVNVTVRCFTRTGVPADSTFVVNWLTAAGMGGRLAYARNFSPTSNCGTPQERYDSRGGGISNCPVTDDPKLVDAARVRMPGLASKRGSVQVSAIARRNTDPSVISIGVCDLIRFLPARNLTDDVHVQDQEWVDLRCYEPGGQAQIYRRHYVWFMQGLGMKGVSRHNVAYLFAARPKAKTYRPDSRFSYSSAGKTMRITRSGPGSYTVALPGMPPGGSAQVTPYGRQPRSCVIASIERSTAPQRVAVRCFDLVGHRKDTKFTLAYAK